MNVWSANVENVRTQCENFQVFKESELKLEIKFLKLFFNQGLTILDFLKLYMYKFFRYLKL